MQEETSKPVSPAIEQPKSNKAKPVLLFFLVIVLILASTVGAYMYRDQKAKTELKEKQTTISQQEKKITELELALAAAKKTATNATTETAPTSSVENIKAAITSGNTAALESYMATNVMVVIAASEVLGSRTPTQAVADLAYLKDSKNWNFSLDATTLNGYKSGFYKDYFKSNSVVGRASDGKVVVFNFNDQGKINGIFLAASDELLTQ